MTRMTRRQQRARLSQRTAFISAAQDRPTDELAELELEKATKDDFLDWRERTYLKFVESAMLGSLTSQLVCRLSRSFP
jgi:hypothetical protein